MHCYIGTTYLLPEATAFYLVGGNRPTNPYLVGGDTY